MKALKDFTNVDKAALLHELFPEEIPALLHFIKGMATSIGHDVELNRMNWEDGLMSFDFWLSLADQIEVNLDMKKSKMTSNPRIFTQYLFEGYLAIFSNHCLLVYSSIENHTSSKFVQAIHLLIK